MKRVILFLFYLSILASCKKGEHIDTQYYSCSYNFTDSSFANPKHQQYQLLLDEMTEAGVVGVTMSVYRPSSGIWLGASGKADIYNNVDMKSCQITRVGSTVKMLTAATIFLLKEEGKLQLDDLISQYIEGDIINRINNAREATIRQLLNHSSGIYNYIQSAQFQTASINNLIKEWHAEDLLEYAYDKQAYFEPGTDVRYSNTGYILLGMLISKIENKPFYDVFKEKIFDPLELSSTSFAATDHIPKGIARGYIDIYSNFQLLESTYFSGWDYYTADGGLISNAHDMNRFFRSLIQGQILNESSLNEMLTWQNPQEQDPEFYPISYGHGIFKIETERGIAYMHSGDAVGYYANMLYFPDDSTTIVYAVNSNYGKMNQIVSTREAMSKIIDTTKP
jgi:D-alanyl-D-alanine carboxypeptidase